MISITGIILISLGVLFIYIYYFPGGARINPNLSGFAFLGNQTAANAMLTLGISIEPTEMYFYFRFSQQKTELISSI